MNNERKVAVMIRRITGYRRRAGPRISRPRLSGRRQLPIHQSRSFDGVLAVTGTT